MYFITRLWKMYKQNTSMNVEIHIHEVKNYKLFIYLWLRPAVLERRQFNNTKIGSYLFLR